MGNLRTSRRDRQRSGTEEYLIEKGGKLSTPSVNLFFNCLENNDDSLFGKKNLSD